MCNIQIAIFWLFWLIFGQKMASHTHRIDFLQERIAHKKFQVQIPTLSKNNCSATWKPNTNQKNFRQYQLRNGQRYKNYVVILWWFIFIVSDIFKPTVMRDHLNFSSWEISLSLTWFFLKNHLNFYFLSNDSYCVKCVSICWIQIVIENKKHEVSFILS